jgi:hypothetical protein
MAYSLSGIATRIWLIFFVGNRIGISGWKFVSTCAPFITLAGSIAIALVGLRSVWEPSGALIGLTIYISFATISYITSLAVIPKGRAFLQKLIVLGKKSLIV